jgi:hypothetical protein
MRQTLGLLFVLIISITRLGLHAQNETTHKTRLLSPYSVTSLLLRLLNDDKAIGTATGFVVQKGGSYYLVTNWHVVTAKNPDTGDLLDPYHRTPDRIQIFQNTKGKLGEWHWVTEELYQNPGHIPRWKEHSATVRRVDVVVLPLAVVDNVEFYPLDLKLRDIPIKISPAGQVSIVGFPYGEASYEGLPIWKSGSVASDVDVDYSDSPEFLIDATARPGMSGSPVYAVRPFGYQQEDGNFMMASGVRFLGIYAGDIDGSSEIGRVWKASALVDIYDNLK